MDKNIIVINETCVVLKSHHLSEPMLIKARSMIGYIHSGSIKSGARLKHLKRNKAWLSIRLNRSYRLLVARRKLFIGPYFCLTHDQFDKWVNRHV